MILKGLLIITLLFSYVASAETYGFRRNGNCYKYNDKGHLEGEVHTSKCGGEISYGIRNNSRCYIFNGGGIMVEAVKDSFCEHLATYSFKRGQCTKYLGRRTLGAVEESLCLPTENDSEKATYEEDYNFSNGAY